MASTSFPERLPRRPHSGLVSGSAERHCRADGLAPEMGRKPSAAARRAAAKAPPPLGEPAGDPLAALGADVFTAVLAHLEPRSLLKCALVSRPWRAAAGADALWRPACERAWAGKSHAPSAAALAALPPGGGPLWKRRFLFADADRRRSALGSHELASFEWRFRFKRTAGVSWSEIDPWWRRKNDADAIRRRFRPLGPGRRAGTLAAPPGAAPDAFDNPASPLRWQMLANGNVQVEQYPPLRSSRVPATWGWRLENEWVLFFTLAPAAELAA